MTTRSAFGGFFRGLGAMLGTLCLLGTGVVGAETTYRATQTGFWDDASIWDKPQAPVNDSEAKINIDASRMVSLTNAATINRLALGDNSRTGELVIDGGRLVANEPGWNAVGYNRSASMILRGGGTLSTTGRLDIGLQDGANGQLNVFTMEADSGDVWIGNDFYLGRSFDGSHSASARVYVHGGELGVGNNFNIKAQGDNVLDIANDARVVIDGDESAKIQGLIAEGKITAHGGSGSVIFDYNVSRSGKTTLRATTEVIEADWRVASALYATNEFIVTPFDALADFGIVGDGATDVTEPLQDALVMIANLGGGALFLPVGDYKVSGTLTIPASVTLRGDWKRPEPGEPVMGTILRAYAGRGNENGTPFITMSASSCVRDLSIWYPEQEADAIVPYPPTIAKGGGATIENITFVNPYTGFTTFVNGTTARPFVRGVYGTPLKLGVEFDCLADIGRMESIRFAPDYWADSGLPGAPTNGEHEAWLYANATGVRVGRIDWSYSCYVTVEGYHVGLALSPGRHDGKDPNGQSYGFHLVGCQTGVYVEESAYAGYQFSRFDIDDAEVGVRVGAAADETTMFHSCEIDASTAAIQCDGSVARVMVMSSNVQRGGIMMNSGYLSVINSDFSGEGAHVRLAPDARGASLLGNRFEGSARVIDHTDYPVEIDHAPISVDAMPAYDHKKPAKAYRPAKSALYVVTEAPFNAAANGVADDTAAFSSALAAAQANGGGTVFVPGGTYRLDGTLLVPSGVELRGIFDMPNGTKSKGSLLNVYSGRGDANGVPFIRLSAGAGVKGFTFHYPEQIYDASDTTNYGMVPYPFLLRGLGADVYAMNLSATIPYQLLDLATYRCDRHYIDYIFSTALKTGIHVGNGAVDGLIHNCQFNPSTYTHAGNYYESIPNGTAADIHDLLWRDATPYLFGHMTNEVLHQNFVFGGARGFHLVSENGAGPSGHSLGFGVDQCTIAMLIDDVGAGGLDPINSQIVTVNGTAGRYLQTGAGLLDDFTMFSLAGWGTHQHSAVVKGGEVELQLFHVAPDAETAPFKVENTGVLRSYGGTLDSYLAGGRPFLLVDPTASALFAGNVINASAGQMPSNSPNTTALGNLRFGASAIPNQTAWNNAAGTRVWNSAGNWSAGVPDSAERAVFENDAVSSALVSAGIDAVAGDVLIGGGSSALDLVEVTGGTLSVSDWMALGFAAPNRGELDVSGGAVSIAGCLYVGVGGEAEARLRAGQVETSALEINAASRVELLDGVLIVAGDAREQIDAYIAAGRIAGAGVLVPNVDYDESVAGKTTVRAVAPPVSQTVWDPPVGASNWMVSAHWSGGVAPESQTSNLKVVFNVDQANECVLEQSAVVAQLVLGDGGTTNGNVLRLAEGADLTAGLEANGSIRWSGVGYTRDATLVVESGSVLRAKDHLWIGFNAEARGEIHIEGGDVHVDGQFGLGWNGGKGTALLRSGSLNLNGFDGARSISGASSLDVEQGVLIINGDRMTAVNDYVSAGKITAYGGAGSLSVDYNQSNAGKTTVTASAPSSGYEAWALGWGVDIGHATNDYDGDFRENLTEYALMGDPTNAMNAGVEPEMRGTSEALLFLHLRRNDDADLVYEIVSKTNLADSASWALGGAVPVGTNVMGAGLFYDVVTNQVATEERESFLRLRVTRP